MNSANQTSEAACEDLGSRILEIAIKMFASSGFAETSMREVVEAAGCTKPALYYHFENKAGLFRKAVEHCHARMGSVQQPLTGEGSFRERLRRSLARVAEHVTAYPDDLRLMFRAENYAGIDNDLFDARSIRAEHVSLVQALLQAGIDAGEVRPDLPVEDAAISLVGMLHFELQLWLDGRSLGDDFAERIVSIYIEGVGR